MIVKLFENEFELLKKALDQYEDEVKLVYNLGKTEVFCSSDDNNFEIIRDACSDYLTIIGFDENYQPTEAGLILENLIDKFYLNK